MIITYLTKRHAASYKQVGASQYNIHVAVGSHIMSKLNIKKMEEDGGERANNYY